MLERGELISHDRQLEERRYAGDSPGARPNHETAPGEPDYPWTYVYGVGGSTLHWPGNTPRFAPEDFRMRSEYGVMEDWPIDFDELLPWYLRAEEALGVAGAPRSPPGVRPAGPPLPGARALPAHAFSPMDRLVLPPLGPYAPLPQARPSESLQGRPACCGSATCELCPVDSRFSPLNGLRAVLDHPRLTLRTETVARGYASMRVGGGRPVSRPSTQAASAFASGAGRTSSPRAASRTRRSCCARAWTARPRAATCSTTPTRRSSSGSDVPRSPVAARRLDRHVRGFPARSLPRARVRRRGDTLQPGDRPQPAAGRRPRSVACGARSCGARRLASGTVSCRSTC